MSNDEMRKKIAEVAFKEELPRVEEIIAKYPTRNLKAGEMITRFAPSPTGFVHIGGLYSALISERLARQTGGVFFLRIEDTDKKREVAGATELIVNSLAKYGIKIDEGETIGGKEIGNYGPYKQSARELIYKAFAKKLVLEDKAYLAFDTEEELQKMSARQSEIKIRPGYYGDFAIWREKKPEEVLEMLESGLKPVVRVKSSGDFSKTMPVADLFRGNLNLPENDNDMVIIKSDGLPTYHFAHLIDDHFMGTTHIIRADEWLSSLTLHLQLFKMMDWPAPIYGHLAPIQKMDGTSRRKLSKRLDPEATMSFYEEQGFPPEAVIAYLLNLANSGFEKWLTEHPKESVFNYPISVEELKGGGGSLLDLVKLADMSKNFIATVSVDELFARGLEWAKKFNPELARAMEADSEYAKKVLNVDKAGDKARKDVSKWADLPFQTGFFFDEIFSKTKIETSELADVPKDDIKIILEKTRAAYSENDSKDEWLVKMRAIATGLGYAPDTKTFKSAPEKYKGHFGAIAKVVRILLVGRNQSPDLYEVMKALGKERIEKRLAPLEVFKNF